MGNVLCSLFISMMNTKLLKMLLVFGSLESKNFLGRIIEGITGYDISEFTLGSQEEVDGYVAIEADEDILLFSKKRDVILNLEVNLMNHPIVKEKNRKYVKKLNKKYNPSVEDNVQIIQINFNRYNYRNKAGNLVLIKKEKLRNCNVIIYDVYLRDLKLLSQLMDHELYSDLAFMDASDLQDRSRLVKNDRVRRKVMEELERLGRDKTFVDLYNHEEYQKDLRQDACKKGYEEGIRYQKEKVIEMMYQNKEDIEKMAIYSGCSKEEIMNFLLKEERG